MDTITYIGTVLALIWIVVLSSLGMIIGHLVGNGIIWVYERCTKQRRALRAREKPLLLSVEKWAIAYAFDMPTTDEDSEAFQLMLCDLVKGYAGRHVKHLRAQRGASRKAEVSSHEE